MSLPKDDAEVLAARWIEGVLLKRDVFSNVERGRFRSDKGEVDAVLRRIDEVPWWSFALARHLFARERRSLAVAGGLRTSPPPLFARRRARVRGWSDGPPLPTAQPPCEPGFFPSPTRALPHPPRRGI